MAALPNMLRKSFSKAAPLATRLIGTRGIVSSAATTTAFSARKGGILSSNLIRHGGCFSSRRFSSEAAISSDKKLVEVVQSEIDVVVQSDDHGKIVTPPSDFPFTVEDNPGEQTITLKREYEGETVLVEVSMPNLVTGEEEEEDEVDEDDENAGAESSVPLLVTVTKKDENAPYLEFDCTAYPDEIRINALSLKNPEAEDQLAYEGPDFLDLDDNLQKAFHKYLEIRGVKPSTTNFLHEYMIEKDNKEYVRWLKDVKSFVEA
ncbi:uncharacterized protein At2g39795, mitochondrial-like [Silene latifolia]|uniref:uncharacterized protein At2g39795, mitochondrial-like n=1 Tax=Silene latifolia TaxID=37657 RepID=UPI003D77991B